MKESIHDLLAARNLATTSEYSYNPTNTERGKISNGMTRSQNKEPVGSKNIEEY